MGRRTEKKSSWRGFLSALLFFSVLVTAGVTALVYDRPEISEVEKRELAKAPQLTVESLFSGEYSRDLSEFFADTFPGREPLIRLAGRIQELGGLRFDEIRIHKGTTQEQMSVMPEVENIPVGMPTTRLPNPTEDVPAEEAQQSQTQQPNEKAPSSAPDPEPAEDEGGALVQIGTVFVYKGKGYEVFGSLPEMGQWYAQVLNYYREQLPEDVKIYNLIIPTAIDFGLPARYQSITQPQKPAIEAIYGELDAGITPVRVWDALNEHKKEYIYFASDHHWTSRGAYYAYGEFAKAAGFNPVNLDALEKRTLENFVGTLYSHTQDSVMAENPDYVEYYMMPVANRCFQFRKNAPYTPIEVSLYGEYAKSPNSYSVFLHGDLPLTRIDTEVKNGRKIAVVKESFGNAFVPYLVNHYEQIFVVDQRYFQTGLRALIEENGIGELLFINNAFAAHTPVRINEIARLLDQVYIPPAPPQPEQTETEGTAEEEFVVLESDEE